MLLARLREEVWKANLDLVRRGLVIDTFGNISAVDRDQGRVVIKPSGVAYEHMTPEDMVVTDLEGQPVDGRLRPSSDLETHLELYRSWPEIRGVAHTHSSYATAWAQARREIPCLGTTHADCFRGPIPVTEMLSQEEIAGTYERNTGRVIARRLTGIPPLEMPAVLVAGHGPFCWAASAMEAARLAFLLEEVARLALLSEQLRSDCPPIPGPLLERHFTRKHGTSAYYGQNRKPE